MFTDIAGRPYIERLRNDNRFRIMIDTWVHQAVTDVAKRDARGFGNRQDMYDVAHEALRLALDFVLKNDAEYEAVCAERDQARKALIDYVQRAPMPIMYVEKP
jgi:hypothetical protein